MSIITETEIKTMQREAQSRLRAGDLDSAVQIQAELVERLIDAGQNAIQNQPFLADQLERAASQLVDSLRWARLYDQAIALQERLLNYLPEIEDALKLGAANLRVEGGEEETGLEQIRAMVAGSPDNYWYQISLGSALLYLDRYDEAEQVLRRAADMTHVRKVDRAMAQEYLLNLYHQQGKSVEALAAWREASRLDASLRSNLMDDVCHLLIYQRKFDEAHKIVAHDAVQVRKTFFNGLIAFFESKPADAKAAWQALVNNNHPTFLKAGQDAYAEACLYLANSTTAIMTLEPLVEQGQTSFERMFMLGLAYAQKGDIERSKRNLSIALRLGDMEKPRKTKASAHGRIFSPYYGLLYVTIPLHPSARQEIDSMFRR